ncbi:GtrA-like protein [compost metagenome]
MINQDFIKFLLVGVLNTAVGLSTIFLLLNLLDFNYWISTFMGNSIGAIVSYCLNKRFTFNSNVSNREAFWKFVSVIVLCYLISYTASYILFDILIGELIHDVALRSNFTALIGAGIYTLLNYIGQKYFVFKKNPSVG